MGEATGEAVRAAFDARTGVHRPYFAAGVAVVLSAGAVWGAYLLWRIGFARSFTAASIHEVNAHGQAQILGWVGLFVMGFAWQMFARWKRAEGPRRLARACLGLMLAGIVARSFGEPLHAAPGMRALALAGALAAVVAVALFAGAMFRALRDPSAVLPAERGYLAVAFAAFLVQAVGEAALLAATTGAATRAELLGVVSTWQAPLRDVQIHAFALMAILGVGLRLFPRTFGLARPSARAVRLGVALIPLAVAAEVAGLVAMRLSGERAWAALLYGGILLLAGTTFALTRRWLPGAAGDPRPRAAELRRDRSVKFVRAAALWLNLSMALLVLAPVHQFLVLPHAGALSESGRHAVEIGFSHAYYGAARHAITVGFVSLTILGVSARLVPMLGGLATTGLRPLWLPFLLVNAGCALRVTLQIATDFTEPAFAAIGASGVLEVAGLALWGGHLLRTMAGRALRVRPAAGAGTGTGELTLAS